MSNIYIQTIKQTNNQTSQILNQLKDDIFIIYINNISSERVCRRNYMKPPCKEGNVRFTTVPFKPLSGKR